MLSKLRRKFGGFFYSLALLLAKGGLRPNHLTFMGLFLSIIIPVITYITKSPLLALVLVLLSSFADVLDGSLARVKGLMTRFGAFLDSLCDRVSDTAYSITLLILGLDPLVVMIFLATSLIISYSRARAESLGLKLEGIGLMERAERILVITIVLIFLTIDRLRYIAISNIVLLIASVLNVLTIVQRGLAVWKYLKGISMKHGSSP